MIIQALSELDNRLEKIIAIANDLTKSVYCDHREPYERCILILPRKTIVASSVYGGDCERYWSLRWGIVSDIVEETVELVVETSEVNDDYCDEDWENGAGIAYNKYKGLWKKLMEIKKRQEELKRKEKGIPVDLVFSTGLRLSVGRVENIKDIYDLMLFANFRKARVVAKGSIVIDTVPKTKQFFDYILTPVNRIPDGTEWIELIEDENGEWIISP